MHLEQSHRSIFVTTVISKDVYNFCFAEVCKHRADSAEPICLYLDSPGGSVWYAELLHKLIKAPRLDNTECSLITIAPSFAASAAANLLILGDYSIVYPHTEVLCHGSRYFEREITTDNTTVIESELRTVNQSHAKKIAFKVFDRLLFRINLFNQDSKSFGWALKEEREPQLESVYSDVFEYFNAIKNKLSSHASPRMGHNCVNGIDFFTGVLESWNQKHKFLKELPIDGTKDSKSTLEALVGYELGRVTSSENFQVFVDRLQSDLNLLSEHPDLGDEVSCLFKRTEKQFFTKSELEDLDEFEGEELKKLKNAALARFIEMWHFTTHLCHRLNEQENIFTAVDCYLLGLVDEISGIQECISKRALLAIDFKKSEKETSE